MFLEQIGADQRVRELFRPLAGDLELGRVCFGAHESFRVCLDPGDCDAVPAGKLRGAASLPVVGDWVAARRIDGCTVRIEAVLPRRTAFSRRSAGTRAYEQVLAANIDVAVIVCGLDGDFNLRRLERYCVLGHGSGAETVIVLNKADVCDALDERIAAVRAIAAGAEVIALSARESVEPLRPVVAHRTSVLLGSSGAGKSTIANGLLRQTRQETAAVREADSRGRHTTTARMLAAIPGGGALIDTPGLRELQLWASEDTVEEAFDDIAAASARCRFGDCSHTGEPGCAVQELLDSGALDEARWKSYRKLQAEARRLEDPLEQKKRWKSIHKAMRHHPKYRR